MFVVWGKIICVGENVVGWGEVSLGVFSNFFCTFGTVTINKPPLKTPFFHGMENQRFSRLLPSSRAVCRDGNIL
jgi:hypothetical protein